MITSFAHESSGEEPNFLKMMGPQVADQMVRTALGMCWKLVPAEKRSLDQVESEFRRLVERAVKDFREDSMAFDVAAKPG